MRSSNLRNILKVSIAASAVLFGYNNASAQEAVKLSPIKIKAQKEETYKVETAKVAGKTAKTLREIPNSVSVLTRQQMDDLNLNTLHEALNWVPGVTIVSNDESQSQFHSRGGALESASDGGSTIGGVSGYQQLDMAIFDRIEVLKGPAGLLQGSGALSGVMNMVKKRATKQFSASAKASVGSWQNYLGEFDVGGSLIKSGKLRARAVFSENDKHYFYDRAKENRWVGYGAIDFDLTASTLITTSYTRQKYDGPSFSGNPAYATGEFLNIPRSTNVYPDWAYIKWDTDETYYGIEQKLFGDWVAKASYTKRNQEFEFKDSYPTNGVDTNLNTSYARRWNIWTYDRDVFDAYLAGSFNALNQKQQVLIGYTNTYWKSQGVRVTAPTVNNINILNPNSVPDFSLPFNTGSVSDIAQDGYYGQLRLKPSTPFTLVLGARVTDYKTHSRNIAPSVETPWVIGTNASDKISYNGGILYDVSPEYTLYASYSDIFVPQTVKDYLGNILDPRIGAQIEAGIKGELFDKNLNFSIAGFHTKETNRSYADPAHPGFYLPIGQISIDGIETEIGGKLMPNWMITGGYTLLHHKYDVASGGIEGLPISGWYPRHQFKIWNKYEIRQGTFSGLSLGGGLIWQSETAAGTSGTSLLRKQGAYSVVDVSADYKITKKISVGLNIDNLFDTTYYTRLGGTNTYNTFGRPRNFTLSIKAKY